jgi:hypothetical protein
MTDGEWALIALIPPASEDLPACTVHHHLDLWSYDRTLDRIRAPSMWCVANKRTAHKPDGCHH